MLEVEEATFYLANNIIDIVFSVLMATFYIVVLNSRESKLFLFIIACASLVFAVITLVFYIIDESYTTLWHKRYFQIRAIVAVLIAMLFISASINLFFEGKELLVLISSFGFLVANVLLTFIVIWSLQMSHAIKQARRDQQMRADKDEEKSHRAADSKKEGKLERAKTSVANKQKTGNK